MDLSSLENIMFSGAFILYVASMFLYLLDFLSSKGSRGMTAINVLVVGFAAHTIAIIARGITAERAPLSNQYEFATAFAWGIALMYLVFSKKYKLEVMGTFVTPIIFLILGYAAMLNKSIRPLMPALQSNWLVFHVSCAIISYGAFAVACGLGIMYLAQPKLEAKDKFKDKLPALGVLDMITYRTVGFGYFMLTLVIITGAIWAERAWGRYWAWDPKETWSLITWIIYSIYLHLRLMKGWRGKKAAIFVVVGFICVIFTYIGVNTLLPSIHSYV